MKGNTARDDDSKIPGWCGLCWVSKRDAFEVLLLIPQCGTGQEIARLNTAKHTSNWPAYYYFSGIAVPVTRNIERLIRLACYNNTKA